MTDIKELTAMLIRIEYRITSCDLGPAASGRAIRYVLSQRSSLRAAN